MLDGRVLECKEVDFESDLCKRSFGAVGAGTDGDDTVSPWADVEGDHVDRRRAALDKLHDAFVDGKLVKQLARTDEDGLPVRMSDGHPGRCGKRDLLHHLQVRGGQVNHSKEVLTVWRKDARVRGFIGWRIIAPGVVCDEAVPPVDGDRHTGDGDDR